MSPNVLLGTTRNCRSAKFGPSENAPKYGASGFNRVLHETGPPKDGGMPRPEAADVLPVLVEREDVLFLPGLAKELAPVEPRLDDQVGAENYDQDRAFEALQHEQL